jgi:uncharacterized OsmC-like protein
MADERRFSLSLRRTVDYQFVTTFDKDGVSPLLLDEPKPLGADKGPNAARLIGAAVGNCLSASLLFCLERAKQTVNGFATDVEGFVRRDEGGRWRLAQLDVQLVLDLTVDRAERVKRCLELFEDYCVVTPSIRKGLQLNVVVTDTQGNELYRGDGAA